MGQTFEFYTVDPGTWKDIKRLDVVRSCSINRELESETLGSATIDVTESLGECYIRVYLITNQNGVTEKHPLGTFLVQSPSTSFDGKTKTISMDAYTPLIELKENQPPLGYYVPKNENIMDFAYRLVRERARAPVVAANCDETLYDDFVADTEDSWMTFLRDFVSQAKYEFTLDDLGRILFAPVQDIASLQPVWTYTDDNSSILLPEVNLDHDLYGIPNVVEVIYSNGKDYYHSRVVNNSPNSPTSIANRGREITYRVTNPDMIGNPTKAMIDEYAEQLLRNLSSLEYTVTYSHGYCPVRVGDCVRLNYNRAGLTDIKAKVISQSIRCEEGCLVQEKAVYTVNLMEVAIDESVQ
jgi:hypothetical protein